MSLQVVFALPQFAADGAVEEDEAEHGAEEVGGGDPEHDVQLPGADGVAGVLTLTCVEVRVCVVVVLHPDQEKSGGGRNQGEHPQGQDDVLHPAPGHHHFAFEREANGQVALDAKGRDVEDGRGGAALKDVVVEAAHGLAEQPGHVLPQAIEVKGQAEKDDQVRHCHAGQVEVGGGLHVLEMLDDENGQGVSRHSDNQDENANDGDGDEGGGGEQGALVVVVIYVEVLHDLCATCIHIYLWSCPGHECSYSNL